MKTKIFAWLLILIGGGIASLIWLDNVGEVSNSFHYAIDGMFSLAALWAAGFGIFMLYDEGRPSTMPVFGS
jgi:hypothetical protein